MAKRMSVFGDEWRRCLREHYKYVKRNQDKATEETLVPILQRFGFEEDELRHLAVEATMRADEMPDDYVPDMEQIAPERVEESQEPEVTFMPHPAECNCPACMDVVLEAGHDEDGQPLDPEDDDPDDGRPRQKSLF